MNQPIYSSLPEYVEGRKNDLMPLRVNNLSMLPIIEPNDRVIIKKTSKVEVDDIIAFLKNNRLIVHRVIYQNPIRQVVITKGDNNKKNDGEVRNSEVLGKVETIIRNKRKIRLQHIYLNQSFWYFRVISKLEREFARNRIPYTILKGLPLHLRYEKNPPRRIYADCDILIDPRFMDKSDQIMATNGFESRNAYIFGRKVQNPSQKDYINKEGSFPVVVDLHFDSSVGFTKIPGFEALVPFKKVLDEYLIKNSEKIQIDNTTHRMLNRTSQVLYLFLHLFHHNYLSIHRLTTISKIIGNDFDWGLLVTQVNSLGVGNFVYGGLLLLNKYFGGVPSQVLNKIKTTETLRKLIEFSALTTNPFNRGGQIHEGIKRYWLLLICSPISAGKKVEIIFSKTAIGYYLETIIFFLSKSFKSWL